MRPELQEILADVRARIARRDACALHELERCDGGKGFPRYRCKHCGWEPNATELVVYEQGLKHGRANPTGGGRCA